MNTAGAWEGENVGMERMTMAGQLRTAALALVVFAVLTGLVYPLVITGIAQLVFPKQANGSLIVRDGKPVGSALIGQPFDDPKYFWGRPSATAPFPYNAGASGGSNLAATNPTQLDAIRQRIERLRTADPVSAAPIPIDSVTASGSGLDPHISVAAAEYQVPRVARTRGLSEDAVLKLVRQHTAGREFGLLGEPRVNVLELNLGLDAVKPDDQLRSISASEKWVVVAGPGP